MIIGRQSVRAPSPVVQDRRPPVRRPLSSSPYQNVKFSWCGIRELPFSFKLNHVEHGSVEIRPPPSRTSSAEVLSIACSVQFAIGERKCGMGLLRGAAWSWLVTYVSEKLIHAPRRPDFGKVYGVTSSRPL